ncbi:unnamed protein product [Dicrocoelium dendriticum]|nr:unnamed protein product [Dicrocoelium dendriticum]
MPWCIFEDILWITTDGNAKAPLVGIMQTVCRISVVPRLMSSAQMSIEAETVHCMCPEVKPITRFTKLGSKLRNKLGMPSPRTLMDLDRLEVCLCATNV